MQQDVMTLPAPIPSTGVASVALLREWYLLLAQKREQRLQRRKREDEKEQSRIWRNDEEEFDSNDASYPLLGILMEEL